MSETCRSAKAWDFSWHFSIKYIKENENGSVK